MKIAINTLSLNKTKAGMGNYIMHLVNTLASIDKKNEYHIFVSSHNLGFFPLHQKNVKIINLGNLITYNIIRFFWEQFMLPFYLFRNRIDVLHSPGFVIPLLSPVKNIATIADMTFFSHPEVHTLFKRAYFGAFLPVSVRSANKVI